MDKQGYAHKTCEKILSKFAGSSSVTEDSIAIFMKTMSTFHSVTPKHLQLCVVNPLTQTDISDLIVLIDKFRLDFEERIKTGFKRAPEIKPMINLSDPKPNF